MTPEEIKAMATEIASQAVAEMKADISRSPIHGEDGERRDLDQPHFKSFGEWLKAVADKYAGRMQPDDWRMKALSEGTDSAGGFLVPEQWAKGIEEASLETAIVRPRARKMPMTTDTLNYPVVADRSHSSSVHGGVIAYWTEEAGTKTKTTPTFGRVKLIAKKLTGFTYGSDELLEDSAIGLEALLIKMFGSAIEWFEEEAFWQGNGVGQPLGIFNSGCVISVSRQTASQVTIRDIGNLCGRFEGNLYAPSVAFVANKACLPWLIEMGSTYITWQIIAGQKVPGTLLGIPIAFSEHVPTLNTLGDIGLYDFDKYLIGDRKGLKIDRSIEYRFSTDETTWRFVKRVDAQPLYDSAFTQKRGNTLSPFVQLNAG